MYLLPFKPIYCNFAAFFMHKRGHILVNPR